MTHIVLISDIHMRDSHAEAIRGELEAVVQEIEAISPEHVFVLGDLIEDSDSPERDEANVEVVHDLLAAAEFPVTYLLGNHDVENLDRKTLSGLLEQEAFYGVEDVAGVPFVYLDSTREHAPGPRGELGSEQLSWLEEALPELTDPVLLVHHPIGNFDLAENDWFRDFPERAFLSDRKEVLRVLEEGDAVRGTISGHIHDTQFTRFFGLPHVSVNAFSKETPDVPLTGTFAEIELGDPFTIDVRTRSTLDASFSLD